MTMTIDTNQQRYPLTFDHMAPYSPHHGPQFTNPWAAPSPTASNPYIGSQGGLQHASLSMDGLRHQQQQHHQQQQQQQQQQQHQQQHHQLPQPVPQQHQHHHAHHQHSPASQPQQSPSHAQQPPHHHHHQQQRQQQQQQQPPPQRPLSQQPLPPAPSQQLHQGANNMPNSSMAYGAGSMTVTAPGGSPHSRGGVADPVYVGQRSGLLSMPQDVLSRIAPPQQQAAAAAAVATTAGGYADAAVAYSAPSPIHPSYATSTAPYDQMGYAPAPSMRAPTTAVPGFSLGPDGSNAAAAAAAEAARRYSQPDVSQVGGESRRGFQDALEASHGILSLSQDTPRPLYGSTSSSGRTERGSGDSYGFPSAHSTSSSVSSTSFNGFYAGGSIDSSVSDYSTAGSDIESVASRAARQPMQQRPPYVPTGAVSGSVPPPPALHSMMSQFSSKMTSTAQKKHKCKVCDKRFTRPSSLQTHMYSHTGEKPFRCDVEGCGRHFSVVSNLRRHRKVHKDHQSPSEAGSEEHHSE